MIKKSLFLFLMIITLSVQSQEDSTTNVYINTADQLMQSNSRLSLGGYGEIHYNQPLTKGLKESGTLDVHRIVMFMGYNFSSKTQFVSEIEFEYAKELWVEQAFLQHKLNKYMNLRAGLILVPMGIINEYHEPTTFHGVERPVIDNKIAPSTWREVGAGFTGTILKASLKYQAYLVGGLNGYDTKGVFSGTKAIREGRQKGSKAYFNQPAFAAKVEYFGIRNLNIGLSTYAGKSASKLNQKLNRDSTILVSRADSSTTEIMMIGADARYQLKGVELRAQFYYTNFSNSMEYNKFTSINGKQNDLPVANMGYYAEMAYNLLQTSDSPYALIPFFRYEWYDLHYKVNENTVKNEQYLNTMLTTGLTFKLHKNAALKADLQFYKSKQEADWSKTFNLGVGVMF